MSFTTGGTVRWMSPELLDPDRFGFADDRPTKQSDCYALGMVVYEVRAEAVIPTFANVRIIYCQVLCGNHPYEDIRDWQLVILRVLDGKRPQKPEAAERLGFAGGLWTVVEQCWAVDAGTRPDVRLVLSHLNHAARYWERRQLV